MRMRFNVMGANASIQPKDSANHNNPYKNSKMMDGCSRIRMTSFQSVSVLSAKIREQQLIRYIGNGGKQPIETFSIFIDMWRKTPTLVVVAEFKRRKNNGL